MPFVRKNLSALPKWDPAILWYARGIAVMQQRPLNDPTSWRWQAGVHGFGPGNLEPGDPPIGKATIDRYLAQCQHGSWYFLPWHRGYLSAFERIVRAAIAAIGTAEAKTAAKTWALPYWDMSKPNWRLIREEFRVQTLPTGEDNPLYVAERNPGFITGNVGITAKGVALDKILKTPDFGGSGGGGGTGFGGPETDFFHGPGALGALEGGIHNYVHGQVGGADGFMSDFDHAGLDPLFWLHHCNIDRLWEVWRRRDGLHKNPADAKWLNGPKTKKFRLYDETGHEWMFTSSQMADTNAQPLDFSYEDVSDPLPGVAIPGHLHGFAKAVPASTGIMAMFGKNRQIEVLGATTPGVSLGSGRQKARVAFAAPKKTGAPGLKGFLGEKPKAERYLLNLENITGTRRGLSYAVYVNLPDDGDPETDEHHFVGMLNLFGVERASDPEDSHGGSGLTFVFDVTGLVREEGAAVTKPGAISVDFVPENADTPDNAAHVGRISLVRETA